MSHPDPQQWPDASAWLAAVLDGERKVPTYTVGDPVGWEIMALVETEGARILSLDHEYGSNTLFRWRGRYFSQNTDDDPSGPTRTPQELLQYCWPLLANGVQVGGAEAVALVHHLDAVSDGPLAIELDGRPVIYDSSLEGDARVREAADGESFVDEDGERWIVDNGAWCRDDMSHA